MNDNKVNAQVNAKKELSTKQKVLKVLSITGNVLLWAFLVFSILMTTLVLVSQDETDLPYVKVRDTHSVIEEHSGGQNFKYKGIFIDIFALEYTHKFVNHRTHMRLRRIRKFGNRHKRSRLVDAIIGWRKRMAFRSFKVWRALSNLFPGQELRHTYGTWCYRKPRYEEDLFPLSTIKFEGYDFPAPHNSDAYLRTIYGDYMQLPDHKEVHTATIEFLE